MNLKSKANYLLDAWAVLSLIYGEEPAGSHVRELLDRRVDADISIHMSWINLGEVFYLIARRKGRKQAGDVLNDIKLLPIKRHLPAESDMLSAALLKSSYTLSYADAFAVALAQKLDAEIYTGDPEIILLEDIVRLHRLHRSGGDASP
jgi:predicted nucleic acid-binding protein